MAGFTQYSTELPWSLIFTIWFVRIDDAYQQVVVRTGPLRTRGPQPRFADSEVITVALMADAFFGGHEARTLAFVRHYHRDLFPHLLSRSRFNRRRRALLNVIEAIRRRLAMSLIDPDDPLRCIDSAPIPLCTSTRGSDNRTVHGAAYAGVCISKRCKVYGFKLHLTVTQQGIIDQWLLAPASYQDLRVAPALLEDQQALVVLGDKAYINGRVTAWLAEARGIQLLGLPRLRERQQWPRTMVRRHSRVRQRVETTLSVLATVFGVQRVGSRSLAGALCRSATRVLAYTLAAHITDLGY